jgi:hypothetical protein
MLGKIRSVVQFVGDVLLSARKRFVQLIARKPQLSAEQWAILNDGRPGVLLRLAMLAYEQDPEERRAFHFRLLKNWNHERYTRQ